MSLPVSTPETPQMLTRNLHGLRKTGRIPCRSMYFTCNLPTTPYFHSRKYPGCHAMYKPGLTSFYFIRSVIQPIGASRSWRAGGFRQTPFYRIYTFPQPPLSNYILSHSSCIVSDTNYAMREGAVHTCSHTHIRQLIPQKQKLVKL